LSEIDISQQTRLGSIVSNTFGEQYLYGINRDAFQGTDASTVFRAYFGEDLFKEDTFYVIAGTDSGLLYQYVSAHGIPKGSRYLFVELPQVLSLLQDFGSQTNGDSPPEILVTSDENWLQQAKKMGVEKYAALKRLFALRSLGVVHSHYDAYRPFWRDLKKAFDNFVWGLELFLGIRRFTLCQIENLTENQIPAICLKNTFTGKTAVVLAGGPSLDALLPWVQKHRKNLLVIAVSRISNSLLNADIEPDIIVSIDPHPLNLSLCEDMFKFQDSALFVNDFHVSSNLLSSWGGQKAYTGLRYPWPTPLEPENLPRAKGTTVTNNCMALAVELGAAQIIFGGVDFCFSPQGYTHANASAEHAMGSMLQSSDQQVETNSGEMADTIRDFVDSAMPLDEVAHEAIQRGCRTINPAPWAMRLPHVEHMLINDIHVEPMDRPAREVIAEHIPPTDNKHRTRIYKDVLGEVDRVLAELKTIKALSSKALVYNRKLFAKKGSDAGFHNKKKVEDIEERLNKNHSEITTFMRSFGIQRFIPALGFDEDLYVEDLEESCRVYHQALVDTSVELTNILRAARARTMARLEEEKPQPKLNRLLEQWRNDQQPGRAIQWATQHKDYIAQLPNAQQQELHEFIDSFDTVVEALRQEYITRIERGVELNGTASRAREYFQLKDQEGLTRLLASLHAHRDKKQATYFTPLAEGYLAELDGKLNKAITAYQKTELGPAYIDALTRLFELFTQKKDLDAALDVLKKLSENSSTYSPMYADLLQATGNIDAAVETYTDYVLANPSDLGTMMKLGKLYQRCGSADGVAMTMNYILDKDPQNQTAITMLASLDQSPATGK
jgi:hypothetical protein